MKTILEQLYRGESLSFEQSQQVFTKVAAGEVSDIELSALVVALKIKGETAAEIAGAAAAFRAVATPFPAVDGLSADSCGTGGDGSNSINISTTAAMVAASLGINMVKHGNRSVSSRSGSADLLANLGVNLDMTPSTAHQCLLQSHLTFLFAPNYHSGVRHAMPVRTTLKTRTIFNILGPLLNPATPDVQLLGVYDPSLCRLMADALAILGCKRALVVHGAGTDEIALHGDTIVAEVNHGEVSDYRLTVADFGVAPAQLAELAGGEPEENALITQQILQGQATEAQQNAVAVNVAAIAWLAGLCESLPEGTQLALEAMKSGKAMQTLQQFIALSN
jgi:anthranilate phosphoribosyltransferase